MGDLIPHLRDLCFSRSGFEVPPGFAQAYVKVHDNDWPRAQDHWEQIVELVLKSKEIDPRAPSARAMREAVAIGSALLHNTPLAERCPLCRRTKRRRLLMSRSLERLFRELLGEAYPEKDARWHDEQTASAMGVADEARSAADLAAGRDRHELRRTVAEALDRLRTKGLSPGEPSATLAVGDVEVTVDARASGSRYSIHFRVSSQRLPVDELEGLWLTAATTGPDTTFLPVRHLAAFDEHGAAGFTNIRAGHWSFETLTPTWDDTAGAFPMPAVHADAVAAATARYTVAAPNRALFTLDDGTDADPVLEITAVVDGPRLIPVRYLDREGGTRRLLVAIAPARTGAARSRVSLVSFAPGAAWEAGDYREAGVLTPADAQLVAESLRAADDRPTLRAWLALAADVPREIGSTIEAFLDRS